MGEILSDKEIEAAREEFGGCEGDACSTCRTGQALIETALTLSHRVSELEEARKGDWERRIVPAVDALEEGDWEFALGVLRARVREEALRREVRLRDRAEDRYKAAIQRFERDGVSARRAGRANIALKARRARVLSMLEGGKVAD